MSSGVAAGWDVLLLCEWIGFMLCDVKIIFVNEKISPIKIKISSCNIPRGGIYYVCKQ